MALIFRELRNAFTLGALMSEDKANILASAFNTTKLWNKIGMQCAMVLTKLFSKSGQVQCNVVVTAITVSRDLVSVLDTLTNRPVRADVRHDPLLSADSTYRVEETATIHKSMGETRFRRAARTSQGFILADISGTKKGT